MYKKQISKYVQENARYLEDVPKHKYFVRWPNPFSTKIFFSDDNTIWFFRLKNMKNKTKKRQNKQKSPLTK